MITFKILRFTFVVYVFHKVNVLVTDIILNIKSHEHLIFTFYISVSRLFELFRRGTCKETTRNFFKAAVRAALVLMVLK